VFFKNLPGWSTVDDSIAEELDESADSAIAGCYVVQEKNTGTLGMLLVIFRLEDVDSAYDYISVYYSRYTAENGENSVYEYKKVLKKYSRTSSKIIITGFEETEDIAVTDINLHYNLVESAKTQAVC
jgi:hypothetical protein